eukprot:gene14555-5625_t
MKPRNTSFMVEDILGLNRGKDRFKSTTKQRGEICNIIGERGADKTLLKSDVKSKEAAKRKRNRYTPTKSRQCFSTAEVSQLEQLFEETIGYPDTSTRRQLALEMQVSEAKIQYLYPENRQLVDVILGVDLSGHSQLVVSLPEFRMPTDESNVLVGSRVKEK